jgi:hypothetical protein
MGFFNILSKLLRWFVWWPFVVISAFNIENAITGNWLSSVLADNAERVPIMISQIYSAITTPWIIYPLLFIGGILTWDLLHYLCKRMNRPGSRFERATLRNKARQASMGFKKSGWMRNYLSNSNALQDINLYFARYDLPLLPLEFLKDEALNRVYSEYTELIALGKNEVGTTYLSAALSKLSTASPTRPSP